jgi:crossover junction endodeoxyribonuclease RuvC
VTCIVGIDPGSLRLGYGILLAEGNRLRHVEHGCLKAPQSQPLHARLALLYGELCEVLDRHAAHEIVIEKVFAARNLSSALTLGHARGMILLAAGQRQLALAEYAPSEIKKAVTGSGRASKEQVHGMVRRLLGVEIDPRELDASDALAMAICHAAALGFQRSLAARISS